MLFYDLEADNQYAPYAKLKSAAVKYGTRPVEMVNSDREWEVFAERVADPDWFKIDFNGVNYDRVVMARHGMPIHPRNAHDVFIMIKTVAPNMAAFSQKFAAFFFLRDPHLPEMRLHAWMKENGVGWEDAHKAPKKMYYKYNAHDVYPQLYNLFRIFWDHIIKDEHWDAYMNGLQMGPPLLEMETEGGVYLDPKLIWRRLRRLQTRNQRLTVKAQRLTHGKVANPNSSAQLGKYLSEVDGVELKMTDSGNFCVKKSVLVDLMEDNELARIAHKIRHTNGTLKYYEAYLNALDDDTYHELRGNCWIPVQFSVNAANTRRFTSQSKYKLNFQNPSPEAKEVQVVPPGYLGGWIDATQIENVVHIFESQDTDRRAAYEADLEWNEYVWLCNRILGTDKTKDELDDKELSRSPQIPNWTIYKQYKTGKLGLNFGMGIGLFCELFGLSREIGIDTFAEIQRACPAIRELQNRVAHDLQRRGYVTDVFGQRYSGPSRMAYKVVAYLIQGCGTGSLPKAQIRANWETLRRADGWLPRKLVKRGEKAGVMCGTTHDENSFRIRLALGDENILRLLQKLMFNMTKKFTPLFDNIPLRAKLYLSRTTAAEAEEVDIRDTKKILEYARS